MDSAPKNHKFSTVITHPIYNTVVSPTNCLLVQKSNQRRTNRPTDLSLNTCYAPFHLAPLVLFVRLRESIFSSHIVAERGNPRLTPRSPRLETRVELLTCSRETIKMVAALVSDFLTRVIVIVVGMLYPGYKSFKAVKAQDVPTQQRWLHYWLVLSLISTLMLVLEPIVYGRIPFYNMIKITVVAFLAHPKTAGYAKVYDALVEPFLDQHTSLIDANLDKLDKATQETAANIVPTAKKYAIQARETVTRQMSKPPMKKAS